MDKVQGSWLYEDVSVKKLAQAYAALSECYIIPKEPPHVIETVSTFFRGYPDTDRILERAWVIRPEEWQWFEVYDSGMSCGILSTMNLFHALTRWAMDVSNVSILGFFRSNQSLYGDILIDAKNATQEELHDFLVNVLENCNNS